MAHPPLSRARARLDREDAVARVWAEHGQSMGRAWAEQGADGGAHVPVRGGQRGGVSARTSPSVANPVNSDTATNCASACRKLARPSLGAGACQKRRGGPTRRRRDVAR
eukprot:4277601-Prymnesium_polylepis.1